MWALKNPSDLTLSVLTAKQNERAERQNAEGRGEAFGGDVHVCDLGRGDGFAGPCGVAS